MNSILSRVLRSLGVPDDQRTSPAPDQISVRGIPVELSNTRPDISTADVLERLDEALAMIERFQPIRFRHLQRDVRAIRVERYACRGAFVPAERTVITELTFLARRDISAAPVASSILHEGVHARVAAFRGHLMRTGLSGGHQGYDYGSVDMAREERLCRRAELAFGRSLPTDVGAPVIERALATLDMDDRDVAPVVDWREAEARVRAADSNSAS